MTRVAMARLSSFWDDDKGALWPCSLVELILDDNEDAINALGLMVMSSSSTSLGAGTVAF